MDLRQISEEIAEKNKEKQPPDLPPLDVSGSELIRYLDVESAKANLRSLKIGKPNIANYNDLLRRITLLAPTIANTLRGNNSSGLPLLHVELENGT